AELPAQPFGWLFTLTQTDETETQISFISSENVLWEGEGLPGSARGVDGVMNIFNTLFLKPDEMKLSFSRKSFSNNPNHGWVSSETESLNPKRPGDRKDAFNTPSLHPVIKWPLWEGVNGFCEIQSSFFLLCKDLGLEAEVFLSAHRHRESGEFISAQSILGTVLINIADLMQRWTSDVLLSVVHRVLLPPAADWSTLQSLVFFVQLEEEALITRSCSSCDRSNKYPPVKAGSYLIQHFNDSYRRKRPLSI
uniref:Isopenicillin N synthase-like Fe(2+) 2OG dioxygenase domain-containing protein n=1 Tax=Salmo trutta TaxID=8032 RepID=A0A674B300_SALTR